MFSLSKFWDRYNINSFFTRRCPRGCHRWFPFRKRSMAFLTVDAVIGNQAFQNGRCHICFSLGLDKAGTGYNFLMELNTLTKCLFIFTTACLRLAFIWCLGQLYHKYLGKQRFIIKFCGDLAVQPGSAVVRKGMLENGGSGLDTGWELTNLVFCLI